ncbi:hypothetical protein DFJ74DRAFT_693793 [Hyaloraphidium curvatum]|nr:hypothetical protein DFJ74DRAFT_693793 [Hyaloraphidium curvatum]
MPVAVGAPIGSAFGNRARASAGILAGTPFFPPPPDIVGSDVFRAMGRDAFVYGSTRKPQLPSAPRHTMQGLDVAEAFFREWGFPAIRSLCPELEDRFAAGRLQGSDVLRNDDELSRDHSWGPQFWLFLGSEDFAAMGDAVSEKLNASSPNPWKGYRLAGGGDKAVIVTSVPAWFASMIGRPSAPTSDVDWDARFESSLYFLRRGAVWFDGTGELTALRAAWSRYPPRVRLTRLKEECFRVWHHGEYNFCWRLVHREDPLAVAIAVGEFVAGTMRLLFLLGGDFAPYWKWLPREFSKLPESAWYEERLKIVAADGDLAVRGEAIKEICVRLRKELLDGGVITGEEDNEWLTGLLNAHEEMGRRLEAMNSQGNDAKAKM